MKFRMKVDDFFEVGGKTIFAGTLQTQELSISRTLCVLEVDGKKVDEIYIDGEVQSGTGHRDLWTSSKWRFDQDMVRTHDVWLIAV